MKKNFMWLASLVAVVLIGFTACDKKDRGETPESGDYGYASFTISLPTVSLKADASSVEDANEGDTYVGTKAEGIVSSVLVGIYNGNECIERIDLDIKKLATDATINGDDVATSPAATASTFTTKAKKIAKEDGATYDIVVFLNPTTAVKGIVAKGRQLADLERAAAYSELDLVSETNGIMMSNAKGLVKFEANKLKETAVAAETAGDKPKVNVDRAVAKVFVKKEVPTPGGALSGAKAEMKGWNLDVVNKKMFYVRQLNFDVTGTTLESETTSRFTSYAKDPNMTWTTSTPNYPTDDFLYITGQSTATNGGSVTLSDISLWQPGYEDANGHYTSENTMDADSQYRPVTTHVVFAIKIIPDNFDKETGYVTYANTPYTIDVFKQKIADSATMNDVENGMPTGFKAEVEALTEGGTSGQDILTSKIDAGKAFVSGNIRFYPDMMNYYAMPIRHFNDTQAPKDMQYGRYGIVRNNIYKLNVTSLKNFGEPVVPDVPDEPDDKKVGYIAMDVTILPWMVRESGYEL